MNHLNRVDLEGRVVFAPELSENGEKHALNFLVENTRHTKKGETKFKYNCVAWGSVAESILGKLKENTFVRISGHLQDNVMELPDGKVFHYSKTCVDYIEID